MNDRKIHVLFITHTSFMGGANRSLLQLIIELKRDYNVFPFVLVPKDGHNSNFTACLKQAQISYLQCHFYWFKGTNIIKALIKYISNLYFYPIILFKLRNHHFDIVHSNGSVIDLGVFISKIKHTKHIWHLREFGKLDFGLKSIFGKFYEKKIYNIGGDVFIAISKRIKQEYIPIITNKKIKIIYNGILPPNKNLYSEHNNPVIQFCCVGMLCPAKNQIEIIHAIHILKSRWNLTNFHLTFIGKEDSDYKLKMKNLIKDYNLDDYITFYKETNDVPSLLKFMDIGLMTSLNEAFGRVTIEYMMQNIAVIASNTGANTELIPNNKYGLLYSLGNIEELANKMKYLIENPQKIKTIAYNSLQYALSKFTSIQNTKQIYKLYLLTI